MNTIPFSQNNVIGSEISPRVHRSKPLPPPPPPTPPPIPSLSPTGKQSQTKPTLGDVFWPADGPNFSALPGVGGMYVKGFGLIRGPPSAIGIPIYFFHPLQPPPFESGVYSGSITFIEGVQDRGYGGRGGHGGGSSGGQGGGHGHGDEDDDHRPSRSSNNSRQPSNNDGPSTPWVPLSKREKTPKPPPPPKASGWQQVLEEMAKKKGGLKKVEEKEQRKVGKLKTGKKKKGEFIDVIDELKHHLARLQGKGDDEAEEEEEDDAPSKPAAKKSVAIADKPAAKEVKFNDTAATSADNKPSSDNNESSSSMKEAASNPSLAKLFAPKLPASSSEGAGTAVKQAAARPAPVSVPYPPPVPVAWPPVPYSGPAILPPTAASSSMIPSTSSSSQHPALAPLVTDFPATPGPISPATSILTSTAAPNLALADPNTEGRYLIPIPALPVGLHTSQRSSSIPLPSGYYIPAPRLDMVEAGKYEFGGLTTQRQIDSINRLIRAAIHQSEHGDQDYPPPTPRSGSSALGSPILPLSLSSPSPRHMLSREASMTSDTHVRKSNHRVSYHDSTPRSTSSSPSTSSRRANGYHISQPASALHPSARETLHASMKDDNDDAWSSFDHISSSSIDHDRIASDDSDSDGNDEDVMNDDDDAMAYNESIDVLQLSRTADGRMQSHIHQARTPVTVNSQLLLPSGFHSTVQRIRRAQLLRVEQQDVLKATELRTYDDEDLAAEMRRSLPTAHHAPRPLTMPRDYESAVDQRMATKSMSYRKSAEKTTFDRLPLCSYIDKVSTHDTALNGGYDDLGKALWTSSLRRESPRREQMRESNMKYLDPYNNLTRTQEPQFSDVLERRRQKTHMKMVQEQQNREQQQHEELRRKERLRLKALAAAQASGSYSPLLVSKTTKRGIYIHKMITKYGKQQQRHKQQQLAANFNNDRGKVINITASDSLEHHLSRDRPQHGDMSWAQVSRHPDYELATALHEHLVRQKELVDIQSYHKNSPNKFLINN